MNSKKKTNIILLISGVLVLLLIFFAINTIFGQIRKASESLIAQKKEILESELRIKNIQDFKANFKQYQQNFNKIDELFVNASEPISFIEFLEGEAAYSELSIEIAPPTSKGKDSGLWQVLEFSLSLEGLYPNFSKFLNRLESAPYLIEPISLSIRKTSNNKDTIVATLSIKTYAK